jgi:hypothetical protein
MAITVTLLQYNICFTLKKVSFYKYLSINWKGIILKTRQTREGHKLAENSLHLNVTEESE